MNNLGSGVSRVLNPDGTEYVEVILQQGRPPLDAEFNLLQELSTGVTRRAVLRDMPSGWLGNDTNASGVFSTNGKWSNFFRFGKQQSGEQKAVLWAAVNGWLVPVTGTRTGTPPGSPDDTDTYNVIALDPPPSNAGDFRIDYVFLEVWQARVAPNPSTLNKPASSAIYRYGNVEGGYSYLSDDIVDPALGFETSQRVQVQYRIRVVKGLVGFTSYPDGFDPATVKAQGAATSPTAFTFANMRTALGDVGLWRAGDGTANTLGTVDGYVYAIPIAAVFRRNSIAWTGDPSQNLNGGFNRNPTAVDRTGIKNFSTTAALSADLSATGLTLTLSSVANIPLPLTPAAAVTIQIGDELVTYQSITTGGTMTLVARGVNGTRPEAHKAGTTVVPVSGRPDGLFADQIALTDVLDLRHVVTPGGIDYQAVLEENLDRLLRGQLRTNWKRSGGGPQGPFVFNQDKITLGSTASGVTQLDGPDNIRQIFSDAAVTQRVNFILKPTASAAPIAVGEAWSLALTATMTTKVSSGAQFGPGDVITFPVAQLKAGLPGGDVDQVRWVTDSNADAFSVRIDGRSDPVPSSAYSLSPASPGSSDDLVLTLGSSFPTTSQRLYITAHCLYGAGRGLARRPDSLHSVAVLFPSADLLLTQRSVATNAFPLKVKGLPFWSKYMAQATDHLPVTAEAYAELGSKTLVLQPLRRMDLPDKALTMDGGAVNLGNLLVSGITGAFNAGLSNLTDTNQVFNGSMIGMVVIVTTGLNAGARYVITAVPGSNNVTLQATAQYPIVNDTNAHYTVQPAYGLMPTTAPDGSPKWTTTDPLGLFSGSTEGATATKNTYITLPRDLVPGWGEYHLPLLWQDQAPFSQGINYLLSVPSGAGPFQNKQKNYCPFSNAAFSYTSFSTLDFNPPGSNPAPYNGTITFSGKTYGGIRKYTDTRGLGRQGLQLPPFYGLGRVWAVYEANDYKLNGSAFDAGTRAPSGSLSAAKNLLRQTVTGPLFWIEKDADGDSTFILNAEALDLSKSPNPIANFAAGNYVIEASIYGFDRGSFDIGSEFRLVLSRQRSEANSGTRASNLGVAIDAPELIVPSTLTVSDEVLVNYSRTPYQGDIWGTQTSSQDVNYAPGPLLSGQVVALTTQFLDQTSLTRPNPKVLEILATLSFSTTLGTGRMSMGATNGLAPSDVGFEDKSTAWPPATSLTPRPRVKLGAIHGLPPIGTGYIGCTERLPLGALYRDKDFRGNSFQPGISAGLLFHREEQFNFASSWAVSSTLEQTDTLLETSYLAGKPGDLIVHLDGTQGDYSVLTNFRVNRGGSLFSASGPTPGGEVGGVYPDDLQVPSGSEDTRVNVLVGKAFLVRNAVTTANATEVSAGSEIMMLIQTTAVAVTHTSFPQSWFTAINANGFLEGNSAADLYRIEGRPITNDYRKITVDPSSIVLTQRALTFIQP